MIKISRRALASYAADLLISGRPAAEVAQRIASLLVESSGAKDLNFLVSDISWELEQRGELVTAQVTTAEPLTKGLLTELKARIKQATNAKQVQLNETIDKSVLGGLKIETANSVWDNTLSRQLNDLREEF